MNGYPRTVMDAHRKRRLQQYIDERLNGSRAQFIMLTGYSKGRLAQLLDPTNEEPFGERAAVFMDRQTGRDLFSPKV